MAKRPASKSGSKGSQKQGTAKAKPARKPGELSRFQKVVIILFVVVFALSTLAGALASVFQAQQSQSVEYNVDYLDENYEPLVSDLEATLAESPDDMSTVLSLANYYSSWGSGVLMLATTDEETSHGNELLDKAVGYYDQYIASGETESVESASTSRAMCLYYGGDVSGALSALEQVTQDWPEYAPAWADLGLLYEVQGQTDEARTAYEKAVELDPDDEQGAKSYAEERLSALDEAAESAEDGTDASTDGTDESSDGTDSSTDASSNDSTDAGSGE